LWSQPKLHLNNVNFLIYDFSIWAKECAREWMSEWVSVWTECVDHFNSWVVILFCSLWMLWIHYLTNLAIQSGVNPTISTVRKNITSLMFALTTFITYLLFRYKHKMQSVYWLHHECLPACLCLSVHLSVHPHGTSRFFMKFDMWVFFRKCQENSSYIKIWQEKQIPYMKVFLYLWQISHSVLLRIGIVSNKNCRENQNTHFMFHNLVPESHAIYEIMWKYIAGSDRPQITI